MHLTNWIRHLQFEIVQSIYKPLQAEIKYFLGQIIWMRKFVARTFFALNYPQKCTIECLLYLEHTTSCSMAKFLKFALVNIFFPFIWLNIYMRLFNTNKIKGIVKKWNLYHEKKLLQWPICSWANIKSFETIWLFIRKWNKEVWKII